MDTKADVGLEIPRTWTDAKLHVCNFRLSHGRNLYPTAYKQTMFLPTQKTQKYHSSLLPHGAHAAVFSIVVMNVRPFNFLFQFW